MLDIALLRNDPDKVRENIRKKFQDQKLPLVDEVIAFDKAYREAQQQAVDVAEIAERFVGRREGCEPSDAVLFAVFPMAGVFRHAVVPLSFHPKVLQKTDGLRRALLQTVFHLRIDGRAEERRLAVVGVEPVWTVAVADVAQ